LIWEKIGDENLSLLCWIWVTRELSKKCWGKSSGFFQEFFEGTRIVWVEGREKKRSSVADFCGV